MQRYQFVFNRLVRVRCSLPCMGSTPIHLIQARSTAILPSRRYTDSSSFSNYRCPVKDGCIHSPFKTIDIPNIPLPHFLLDEVKAFGDRPVYQDDLAGATVSFQQCIDRVRSLASGFSALGFKKGDHCCFISLNHLDYMPVILALGLIGCVPALVSPAMSANDVAQILKIADCTHVICSPTLVSVVQDAVKCALRDGIVMQKMIVLGSQGVEKFQPLSSVVEIGKMNKVPDVDIDTENDIFVLPFSSGTSGFPKPVMLTHRSMLSNMLQLKYSEFSGTFRTPDDIVVIIHDKFDLTRVLKSIQTYKANHLDAVPPVCLALAKSPIVDDFDISSLSQIISAAAPLGEELSQMLVSRLELASLRQGYGLTELSPISHITPTTGWKFGKVGIPVPNTLCKIVDVSTHETLGPFENGEVWLKGPQLMKGYYKNLDATNDCVTPDGWLRSGDIGHCDNDGYLQIVDRLKELIKYKGLQVPPAELEALLLSHTSIADAAVLGVPDDEAGELPKAFVVRKPGTTITEEEIKQFVAENKEAYKKLRGGVEFLDILPKTASGKLLRRELRNRN